MKKIAINCTTYETRIGIIEDGSLAELLFERRDEESIVGNIYKGRVVKVLPGMQAAFVHIGLEKAGFLSIKEVQIPADLPEHKQHNIRHLLHEGEEVLVQVNKEPIGTKGPRLTTKLSLPGRYVIYMPGINQIGISKRIQDEAERERLKNVIVSLKEDDEGVILRTAARHASIEELQEDFLELRHQWLEALIAHKGVRPPALVYRDQDFITQVLRNYFDMSVAEIIVDRAQEYRKIVKLKDELAPNNDVRTTLYQGRVSLFHYLQIETEITKALQKEVPLKSGGSLVIEQTEALTVIDVNTRRFTGRDDQSQTILRTNIEAAHEALRQLRLRNIGGMILIDFIDMHDEVHQQNVLAALEAGIKKDRTPVYLFGLTRLGLIELTRKKIKESVEKRLTSSCPCCKGTGRINSPETTLLHIEITLREYRNADINTVYIDVHQDVVDAQKILFPNWVDDLEKELRFRIEFKGRLDVSHDHFALMFG